MKRKRNKIDGGTRVAILEDNENYTIVGRKYNAVTVGVEDASFISFHLTQRDANIRFKNLITKAKKAGVKIIYNGKPKRG